MAEELKPELIVLDEVMKSAFERTNFGPSDPRQLVGECLLKMCCGFGNGSTILRVCRDLGLINRKSDTLTKTGKRYLWSFSIGFIRKFTKVTSEESTKAISDLEKAVDSELLGRIKTLRAYISQLEAENGRLCAPLGVYAKRTNGETD